MAGAEFDELVAVMARLRSPGGCPWDREQNLGTIRTYLIEEVFEAVDAIDRNDMDGTREELGDSLFEIVFLARLLEEAGHGDIRAVVAGVTEKIKRRHPHIFGDTVASTAAEVERNWQRIKAEEKGGRTRGSVLDGIPASLPALLRAVRAGERTAAVGFDWPGPEGALEKVREELAELESEMATGARPGRLLAEMGDLLFAVVNLARKLRLDPDAALAAALREFGRRFGLVEERLRRQGRRPDEATPEELDRLWREVKAGVPADGGVSGPADR